MYSTTCGIAEIKLYSVSGSLVYSAEMRNELHDVNTSKLSPGLYLLNIRTEAGQLNKKIVVE